MTEEEKRVFKYKDYPKGSVGKRVYDSVFLSFDRYLAKYYQSPDLSTWEIWQKKYLSPAFEESRHEEMIKNFGYVSIDRHDFEAQNKIYNQLQSDERLDDETRKFIGFMAGTGFFKKASIDITNWFEMENWTNPAGKFEDWKGRAINDILSYTYGLNYLKANLPQMPYWKR